jgi:V8-like Glu-specific endopeptidase
MTYHTKTNETLGATNTALENGLVRSSGGTGPSGKKPGSLTGTTVIPDPVPPTPPSDLVSTTNAPEEPEMPVGTTLPGLEPVPGYIPRVDLMPAHENSGIEECRPMPADCQAPTAEQEEFILVRRCGWQPRRRPNRSMENGLERRRLFGRGSRTRGFLKRLGNRLSDNGVGRGGIVGDVLGALEASPSIGTLEVVIGDKDDRVQIENTTAAPFSGITQLEITARDGRQYMGTGMMVGRTQHASVFLTAAHCVYYHEGGGFPRKVTLSPGRNGDAFPFGRYVIEPDQDIGEILVPQGWINNRDRTQDYALFIVPDPVQGPEGDVPHVFKYAALTDSQLAGKLANIAGFPVDLNNALMFGELLFYHAERITGIEDRIVFYQTDTTGGQSGSPVFHTDPGTGEQRLYAIHTMGDSYNFNSAVRITPEIVAQIDAVIQSVS